MKDYIEYGTASLGNLKLDSKQATDKKLTDNNYEMYFKIQSLYKKVFEYKMNEILNLSQINDTLKNSGLDFGVVFSKRKRYYHRISYLNLDYLYIQNFLFIEKLTEEQLDIFRKRILDKNYEIDDILLNIVNDTYKSVMAYTNELFEGKRVIVCYGVESPANHFYNDSLVIRIEYGRNTKRLNDKEFLDNYNKKKRLIEEKIDELKEKGKINDINIETSVMKIM